MDEANVEGNRPRVILAEDDAELRELLTHTLTLDGYEVLAAASGTRLGELIREHVLGEEPQPGVELIVSDVRMPGPSGLEVLEQLRGQEWATPVLLMTAFGDAGTRAEARRLGAVAVLEKPFDLDDFRTAVANATVMTELRRR